MVHLTLVKLLQVMEVLVVVEEIKAKLEELVQLDKVIMVEQVQVLLLIIHLEVEEEQEQ